MSSVSRWRDSGHLARAVETAGGKEAFDAAVTAMLDDARGWRPAEMRKRHGMTQEQVAVRMGVSVARVSQLPFAVEHVLVEQWGGGRWARRSRATHLHANKDQAVVSG